MSLKASLPGARDAIVGQGGVPSRPLYVFLQNVASKVDGIAAQSGNVTIPDLPISPNANVTGAFSIYAQGTLQGGVVRVSLKGDVQTPSNTQYYGSDGTGARGWFNVSDALAESSNVTLTVGADGVTTPDLSAGVLSSLALADSAVQPGDLAAVATSGAYSDLSGLPTLGTAAATDASDYATAAQGALADTALQPGANVSTLTNDAGYVDAVGAATAAPIQSLVEGANITIDTTDPQNPVISATGGGGGAVDSVNGQTGTVVLDASDVGAEPAITAGTSDQYLDGAKSWQNFATSVRAAVLTGLSTATSAVIAATDTVLQAFGKLQAQITDNLLPKGYIDGHQVVWNGPNAITVTSGAAYIEGAGLVLRDDTDTALTGLSLAGSTWYHLYRYDNAGTPDIEISTTAPAAPYNGTARSKTGDSSRRYIGVSLLTDASGNLYEVYHYGQSIRYAKPTNAAPFRLVGNGVATTDTALSISGIVPSTACAITLKANNYLTTTGSTQVLNVGSAVGKYQFVLQPNGGASIAFGDVPIESGSSHIYYFYNGAPSSGGAFIDVLGFVVER